MQGTIVSVAVVEGATVRRGEVVLVMNSMKMEHVVHAAYSGRVWKVLYCTYCTYCLLYSYLTHTVL
jgi:biotin carboxyl carrier protein